MLVVANNGQIFNVLKNVEILNHFFDNTCFFLYKHISFGDQGSDMLSQNLEGGSNYASDILILISWG